MTAQEIPDDIGIIDMVAIAAGTGHRGTPAAPQLCVSPHISRNLLKMIKSTAGQTELRTDRRCFLLAVKSDPVGIGGDVADKTAQLALVGVAVGQGLGAHGGIKLGKGGFVVCHQENLSQAQGEQTEQLPADEGKLQQEGMKFLPLHHLAAEFHGAPGGEIRVFRHEIGDQAVGIGPVNTGNDDNGAKKDLKVGQKQNLDHVEIGPSENTEQRPHRGLALAAFHHITAQTGCQGRRDKGAVHHPDDCADQDTDGTRLDDLVFLMDRPISSLIRIEKTDSNSGNVVLKPGAAYIIHDINNTWFDYIMDGKTTAEKEAYKDQYGDLVVQYSQGEYVGTSDNPFTTKVVASAENINKSTYIDTIEALPAGTYELEELEAPSGYVLQGHEGVIRKNRTLDPNYTYYETEENGEWTSTPQGRIRFMVSSEYAVYDASIGSFITEVRQDNNPVIGKISIYAEGERLVGAHQDGTTIVDRLADKISGFFNSIKGLFGLDTATEEGLTEAELSEYQNYTFDYEVGPVAGAEFVLYAAEDIYSQEYDEQALERLKTAGTPVEPLFKAGEAVLTLTTNANGQAWTGSEDWPGTDEAKGLPLGKYYLVQTVAGEGFVLTDVLSASRRACLSANARGEPP